MHSLNTFKKSGLHWIYAIYFIKYNFLKYYGFVYKKFLNDLFGQGGI